MRFVLNSIVVSLVTIISPMGYVLGDQVTYTCNPTYTVGFVHRKDRNVWEPSVFTDSPQLKLTQTNRADDEALWKFSRGSADPEYSVCEERGGFETNFVRCETILVEFFSFSTESMEFQYYNPGGYLVGTEHGSPHIAIGVCKAE